MPDFFPMKYGDIHNTDHSIASLYFIILIMYRRMARNNPAIILL
jgi:hypothetical protein